MWMPSRKAGGIPRVKTILILSREDEQADAGRGGLTCLAKPNVQARTGTTGKNVFSAQLTTTRRIGNHTQLVHSLLKVLTTHAYIHTLRDAFVLFAFLFFLKASQVFLFLWTTLQLFFFPHSEVHNQVIGSLPPFNSSRGFSASRVKFVFST